MDVKELTELLNKYPDIKRHVEEMLLFIDGTNEEVNWVYISILDLISSELKVKENGTICKILTIKEPNEIRYVPSEVIKNNQDFFLEVLKKKPTVFKFIKPFDGIDEFCIQLLKCTRCGELLGFIPKEKRTYELCKIAIMDNPLELKNVPQWIQDKNSID